MKPRYGQPFTFQSLRRFCLGWDVAGADHGVQTLHVSIAEAILFGLGLDVHRRPIAAGPVSIAEAILFGLGPSGSSGLMNFSTVSIAEAILFGLGPSGL